MTIARRGLRAITVDGVRYVWRMPPASRCGCCHLKAGVICAASRKGKILQLAPPSLWSELRVYTPEYIARRIRAALALGWRPGEGSGCFSGGHDIPL